MTVSSGRFKQRRDTEAVWAGSTLPLLAGELGWVSDTKYLKAGDGSTLWASLSPLNAAPASIYDYGDTENIPVNAEGALFVYVTGRWRPGIELPVVGGVAEFPLDALDDVQYPSAPLDGQSLVWNGSSELWESKEPAATDVTSTTAPINATDVGESGEIRYDAGYIYVCVASNTWKRAPLTTW